MQDRSGSDMGGRTRHHERHEQHEKRRKEERIDQSQAWGQSSTAVWMINSDNQPRRSTQEAGPLSRSSNRSGDCVVFMVGKLTQTAIPGQARKAHLGDNGVFHHHEEPGMSDQPHTLHTLKVWDLPTRLFHWTLVILMIAQWWTAEQSSTMDWHLWGGYAVLTLVLFRLIWGFTGSETARFTDFIRGPGAALDYLKALLRGETPHYLGHNPMGAWSIVALLTLLLIQAITGLFANDDIMIEGPLYGWVSKATSDWLTTIHKLNFNLLLAMIAVHLGAVFFYLLVKRENLIHPMLSGNKSVPAERAGQVPRIVSPWRGLAVLALAGVSVWLLVR